MIFLPLLDATRPWQLRYALGDGLRGVCQVAYRFDTIDRTLGELKHLHVGDALRQSLCRTWVRTLAGPDAPLHIYVDAHLKAHWTQRFMPCGHLPLLDRGMPCTRQVFVTNPAGYVWEILDRVGDASLGQELPGVEQEIEGLTQQRVTLTVVDREANSLELAQIYAQSDHFSLLTLLDNPVSAGLEAGSPELAEVFRLTGRWQPLPTEPAQSLAPARWAPARAADDDPRVLWLVRDEATLKLRAVYALSQPVADCAPDVADRLRGRGVCATYRRRWTASENVIRELVGGGNLNENYGYEVQEVPNRLRQHQQQDAQAQVTTTEKQLATAQRQRETLTAQSTEREQALAEHLAELTTVRTEREAEGTARRQAGQATRRVEQQLAHLARETQTRRARHARRTDQFERQTRALAVRQAELETKLVERRAVLAAIDLTEPMPAPSACWARVFERDLEKDQLMANFQAALLNAHRWCCDQYFTGEWSHLELETATARIYRQRGRVVYSTERVDVTLAAFDYRAEQELATAACVRFNAAQVHDAEGRLIVIAVAPFKHCVKQL
ncbi:MAG: hypothetical protein HYR71_07710 [Chloroflexi bacterium]|nr:hypothetical protein [Chloroflexota bacterium]